MQNYPHHYKVSGKTTVESDVNVSADSLPDIVTAPPKEFGGPGDKWSPESLLVGSVADCFILSFKAISRASKFTWESLECNVEGILDKVDKVTKFTEFNINAILEIEKGGNIEQANRLLEKAEHFCLISNSLSAVKNLTVKVKEV